jgi:hypothetical protein
VILGVRVGVVLVMARHHAARRPTARHAISLAAGSARFDGRSNLLNQLGSFFSQVRHDGTFRDGE